MIRRKRLVVAVPSCCLGTLEPARSERRESGRHVRLHHLCPAACRACRRRREGTPSVLHAVGGPLGQGLTPLGCPRILVRRNEMTFDCGPAIAGLY